MKEYTFCGYKIIAGSNARENDRLVLTSDNTDMWFHVQDSPGRHVVVKTCGDIPDEVIRYAANIASGGKKVCVSYTRILNVYKNRYSKHGEVEISDHFTVMA
jgi:predicted ribosome quality control (RQC) complex YloA/Tae2 family protein